MYPVSVCVRTVALPGPFTSVRSGSTPLCWAVTVERWQVYERQRDGGGAKGLRESEAASEFFWKQGTYRRIYTPRACCLRGWTERWANQMCYLYGVKARLLAEYVRNPSLTLSLTFMLPSSTTPRMRPGVWRFLKDKARGWGPRGRRALPTHTATCQMMQLKMIVQQDWVCFF